MNDTITRGQLSKVLGVSVFTLIRWEKRGQLPHPSVTSDLKFAYDIDEVKRYLLAFHDSMLGKLIHHLDQ